MRALETAPVEERDAMRSFVQNYLLAMVEPAERERVARLASPPARHPDVPGEE